MRSDKKSITEEEKRKKLYGGGRILNYEGVKTGANDIDKSDYQSKADSRDFVNEGIVPGLIIKKADEVETTLSRPLIRTFMVILSILVLTLSIWAFVLAARA